MTRESIVKNIVLAIVLIIGAALGILNGNYIVAAMYIGAVLVAAYIMKDNDTYNLLYAVLLVSVFFDYSLYVPGFESIYMFHIVLGAFTLLSLYRAIRDRDVLMNLDRKILAIYVIWFIYMCGSISWALNKHLSIKYIAIYLMMFAFIIDMMIYNINKERLNNTIKLLLYLMSFIVVIGFVEVILGQQLPIKHYIDGFVESLPKWQVNVINARPMAFSFNPNNLAATLAILTPLCFYGIYKFENIIVKIWFTLVSCAAFSLVVITTSRTGFVAIAFGFAVYVIYSIVSIKRLGIAQMIFPIILIVGLILSWNYSLNLMNIKPVEDESQEYIGGVSLSGKMHSLASSEIEIGEEGSVNVRATIIDDVLIKGLIQNKNILGYGVGNVEQYVRNQGNTGSIYSPHCYAIEMLGDFGLPGVALYGIYYLYLLIGNLIIGIKKKSIMCFAAVAGLIAFAPASFGPSSITYVFSYWILIGFAVSCMQIYKKEDNGYRPTSSIKEFRIM